MTAHAVLGVDIGTSSSKGVVVSTRGEILSRAERQHHVQRPRPDQAEMDARVWWHEFTELSRQLLPAVGAGIVSIGASYGSAYLAAAAVGDPVLDQWNPVAGTVQPRPNLRARYDELYRLYRELYVSTADVAHALAEQQFQSCDAPPERTAQKAAPP